MSTSINRRLGFAIAWSICFGGVLVSKAQAQDVRLLSDHQLAANSVSSTADDLATKFSQLVSNAIEEKQIQDGAVPALNPPKDIDSQDSITSKQKSPKQETTADVSKETKETKETKESKVNNNNAVEQTQKSSDTTLSDSHNTSDNSNLSKSEFKGFTSTTGKSDLVSTNKQSGALSQSLNTPGGLIQWVISTLGVLGFIFFLAYILRKSRFVQRSIGVMNVEGQIALGPKERLVRVKVGNRHLLLGVTPNQVNLVLDLGEHELHNNLFEQETNKEKQVQAKSTSVLVEQEISKLSDAELLEQTKHLEVAEDVHPERPFSEDEQTAEAKKQACRELALKEILAKKAQIQNSEQASSDIKALKKEQDAQVESSNNIESSNKVEFSQQVATIKQDSNCLNEVSNEVHKNVANVNDTELENKAEIAENTVCSENCTQVAIAEGDTNILSVEPRYVHRDTSKEELTQEQDINKEIESKNDSTLSLDQNQKDHDFASLLSKEQAYVSASSSLNESKELLHKEKQDDNQEQETIASFETDSVADAVAETEADAILSKVQESKLQTKQECVAEDNLDHQSEVVLAKKTNLDNISIVSRNEQEFTSHKETVADTVTEIATETATDTAEIAMSSAKAEDNFTRIDCLKDSSFKTNSEVVNNTSNSSNSNNINTNNNEHSFHGSARKRRKHKRR